MHFHVPDRSVCGTAPLFVRVAGRASTSSQALTICARCLRRGVPAAGGEIVLEVVQLAGGRESRQVTAGFASTYFRNIWPQLGRVEVRGPRRHRLAAHRVEHRAVFERPVHEHRHAASAASGSRRCSASRVPAE